MHVNVKLAQEDGKLLDYTLQYRPIIGKLLYLTITRPDLCYAMNHLSQFLAKPRVPHLQVVVHVLQYIKNTIGQSPFYLASTSVQLKAFADADQGTCLGKWLLWLLCFSWRLVGFFEIQETTYSVEIFS